MQPISLLILAAAGLTSAALMETDSGVTTLSSTTTWTQTVTVTRCNSDVSSCPVWATSTSVPVVEEPAITSSSSSSSSWSVSADWPASNSTVHAGPTGTGRGSLFANSTSSSWTSIAKPTSDSTGSNSGSSAESPSVSGVVTGGAAAGVFVQSGMMLGLLAAGVAILA